MDDRQWMDKIDAFIRENERDIVRDIAEVVAVRSVEEAAAPGAPFGAGPRKALDTALAIARRMGFATSDGEGYVGWAELPGREEGYLATITHVDIVPEGEDWTGDPLVLREKDGWLIGRGVGDDKGPGILCLYAAKFLKDNAPSLRYGLRVLMGTNEETGMGDVDYYLEHNPEPLFCFSPDAEFPVCNGEKGVYGGTFTSPALSGALVEFEGGIAGNVIPGKARCVVRTGKALSSTDRVTATPAGDGLVRLDAVGIGGHAAMPEGTLNAIGLLVDYLLTNGLCAGPEEAFLRLLQDLHRVTDGSGLGIACADEVFTPLTCIGGTISFKDGVLTQGINVRYPTATTSEEITSILTEKAAKHGAAYQFTSEAKPFYIDADSAPIDALLRSYSDVMGHAGKPFTMGGGTYARHFKNAVSYGPQEHDRQLPDFVGPEHAPDEGVYLPDMLKALKVYILALLRLQEVDF